MATTDPIRAAIARAETVVAQGNRRYVRVRISLQTEDGIAILRTDTVINADDLAQMIPVVPEPGNVGRWAWDLLPGNTGGRMIFEIIG